MSDLTQAAGTPLKVTIRDKEYELYPITIDDFSLYKQEIKSKRIKVVMDTVTEKSERMDLIMNITKEEISDTEMQNGIASLDGNIFFLWRALLGKYPDMTRDDVGKLIGLDNLPEISAVILALGTGETKGKKVKAGKR